MRGVLAVLALAVSGCAPPIRTGAFGSAVTVWEQGRGCDVRPTASSTFDPAAPQMGDPAPDTERVRGLRAAAEAGDATAQYRLGLQIYRGQAAGSLFDALGMLRRAGQGGSVAAQKAAGRLYMTGLDTMGQDLQEAQRWLSMAAPQDAEARRWLAQVERGLAADRSYRFELQRLSLETQVFWQRWAAAAWLDPWPAYGVRY